MKAIAIDFETANGSRASACAIGLAWVDGGKVVRVEERLIRPREMRFENFNIGIHGIRPEHVAGKPELPEVLAEFRDDLAGAVVLAHNAAFDMSVLRAGLDQYGLSYPEFGYLCTCKMARLVWPELPSVALDAVSHHLGLALDHHQADSDAAACAGIALAAARKLGVARIRDIPTRICLQPGIMTSDSYRSCSSRKNTKPEGFSPAAVPAHSLSGKSVVITGKLQRMTREEAWRRVVEVGGVVQDDVTKQTHIVVAGGIPSSAALVVSGTGKCMKALAKQMNGAAIEVLAEDEFYRLLELPLIAPETGGRQSE